MSFSFRRVLTTWALCALVASMLAAPAWAAPAAPTPAAKPAAPAPAKPTAETQAPRAGSQIHGVVFADANGDGVADRTEEGLAGLAVRLDAPNWRVYRADTDEAGEFRFENLPAGIYRLSLKAPEGQVHTTAERQEIRVDGANKVAFNFGLVAEESATDAADLARVPPEVAMEESAEPAATATDPEMELAAEVEEATDVAAEAGEETPELPLLAEAGEEADEGEQVMSMRAVTSLELRFAPGRNTLEQVAKRALANGVTWLGVPFRTQIDGTDFQFVNCGPASLTMVLAAYGLDVGAAHVRDYLNYLVDDYDDDTGTSLDALSEIARRAGLQALDLYGDRGGYRAWSVEGIRWHVEQGRPVITLVRYRDLPGHTNSPAQTDHYVVITGLTPGGFIYNDAAFASTLGYGLEISDEELERAWQNSSIPYHAAAFALQREGANLSFPERPSDALPLEEREELMSQEEEASDVVETGTSLVAAEMPAFTGAAFSPVEADRVTPEEADLPAPDLADAAPMGLQMDELDRRSPYRTEPGPHRLAGQVAVALGSLWAIALIWALAGWVLRAVARAGQPLRAMAAALAAAIR